MKKLICAIFCSILCFGSINVFAGSIDFSQYSLEDLIQIQQDLDSAIYEKGGFVTAEIGVYVVGRDIAEGSYTLKPFPADGPDGLGVLYYVIYKSETAKDEYETKSSTDENINRADYISAEGKLDSERFESGRIDIKEGEVIEFTRSWGPVIIAISKATGLFMD